MLRPIAGLSGETLCFSRLAAVCAGSPPGSGRHEYERVTSPGGQNESSTRTVKTRASVAAPPPGSMMYCTSPLRINAGKMWTP